MNIRHHLWEEQWKRICCPLGRWCGWASDKNFSERGVWHYNNLRCWPRASECAAARWARHVTGNTPAPAALSAPTLVAPAPPRDPGWRLLRLCQGPSSLLGLTSLLLASPLLQASWQGLLPKDLPSPAGGTSAACPEGQRSAGAQPWSGRFNRCLSEAR